MKRLIVALLSIAILGCSAWKDFFSDNKTVIRLATQMATLQVIEREVGAEARDRKARKIKDIADSIVAVSTTGVLVSSAQIKDAVYAKVDMGTLEVSEKLLLDTLIDSVSVTVSEAVTTENINDLVDLKIIFTWVSQAAEMYIINDVQGMTQVKLAYYRI